MRVRDVVAALESFAPLTLAESWDRVGLIVGDAERALRGPVLLTIDFTPAVLAEAIDIGAAMVVSYHPPIWDPLPRLTTATSRQRVILHAAERGLAVYSPHTALDSAPGGISDWLCEGLSGGSEGKIRGDCRALVPRSAIEPTQEVKIVTFVPEAQAERVRHALATAGAGIIGNYTVCSFNARGQGTFLGGPGSAPAIGSAGQLETADEIRIEMVCSKAALPLALETLRGFHPYEEPPIDVYELLPKPTRASGMGRRLVLDQPATLAELGRRLQKHLGTPTVLAASPKAASAEHAGPYTRLGVIPGAGASLAGVATSSQCEVFVTGEMKHHEIMDVLHAGACVLLGGHTPTERGYLPRLAARLRERAAGLDVRISAADRDPLHPVGLAAH